MGENGILGDTTKFEKQYLRNNSTCETEQYLRNITAFFFMAGGNYNLLSC